MPAAATTYSPTGGYSKSFLQMVWANRAQLEERERRGLIQFLYLTACSHIEHVLQELISARLQFVSERINWTASSLQTLHGPLPNDEGGLNPVAWTIVCMANSLITQARSAPIQKLQEIYSNIYPTSFKAVVGPELHKDLEALAKVRNHFAHGRQLIVEFNSPPPYLPTDHDRLEADVTKSSLHHAYERLKAIGIQFPEVVNMANRQEWMAVIYSDQAVKYFLRSCTQAEEKLLSANAFCGEASTINTLPLPSFE